MNLLFICDEYPPGPHGGIGTAVQLLARSLVHAGNRVWVAGLYDYGYGGKDREEDQGVVVYRLRKKSERLRVSMRYTFYDKVMRRLLSATGLLEKETEEGLDRLLRLIEEIDKKHGIDLIEVPDHQHFSRQVTRPLHLRFPAVPVVCRLHGGNAYFAAEAGLPSPHTALAIEKNLLEKAAAISSVSMYTARKTCELLGVKREAVIIPNGVSVPSPPVFSGKDANRVVFTGSLLPKKGIFELMVAWNEIHRQYPHAQLYVYGKGDTAPLQKILTETALPTVFFKGHTPRPDLLEALQTAAIAVLPSYAEAFAIAPLETMANGLATVYSSRTSGPELLTDGVNGLLIDPANPAEIAGATLSLLRDKNLRESLAWRGYKEIAAHYSLEKITEKHLDFYNTVIRGFRKI